jgi:MFS family permease
MAVGLAVIAAADATLILAAAHGWAVSACVAVAGAGLGLSSVASTTLGTTVADTLRGTASGIINTAAQLGTATSVAVVLLIAAATTGLPGPGTSAPVIAWATAAAIAAAGALAFTRSPQPESAATHTAGPEANTGLGSERPPATLLMQPWPNCRRSSRCDAEPVAPHVRPGALGTSSWGSWRPTESGASHTASAVSVARPGRAQGRHGCVSSP